MRNKIDIIRQELQKCLSLAKNEDIYGSNDTTEGLLVLYNKPTNYSEVVT